MFGQGKQSCANHLSKKQENAIIKPFLSLFYEQPALKSKRVDMR